MLDHRRHIKQVIHLLYHNDIQLRCSFVIYLAGDAYTNLVDVHLVSIQPARKYYQLGQVSNQANWSLRRPN